MGLDMYLFKRAKPSKNVKLRVALALLEEDKDKQVAYWRKEYGLNEICLSYYWKNRNKIKELCSKKEIAHSDIDLNCKYISLTKEDLIQINKDFPDFQIKEVIEETDFEEFEIYYYAWW